MLALITLSNLNEGSEPFGQYGKLIQYSKLVDEAKKIINSVNLLSEEKSPFNKDIDNLNEILKDKLPNYAGGSGRYRFAKLLTAEDVDGIIVVSSMYENTAAILKI